jgi:hypothetical protein
MIFFIASLVGLFAGVLVFTFLLMVASRAQKAKNQAKG